MTPSRLAIWLQLFRAPNLFTVPGDPLAGFLLATSRSLPNHTHLVAVVVASLCFYSAGLLSNDLADIEVDRRERPERPLPSGRATPRTVLIVSIVLLTLGIIACGLVGRAACFTGAGLIASIASYNLISKNIPIIGPLNMGLCRGLSLWLGVTAAHDRAFFPQPALVAAVLLTLYIATVTFIAHREMDPQRIGAQRWMPVILLLSGSFVFLQTASHEKMAVAFILIIAVMLAIAGARQLALPHASVPRTIGLWISLLLLLQAAFAAGAGRMQASALLLALWPVSRIVGRRFYAS